MTAKIGMPLCVGRQIHVLTPTNGQLGQWVEGFMQRYEYRVVPAPRKGEKARGLKTVEERFAYALTAMMNKMGVEGWEYQRADALPCDERVGLTGTKTVFQNMLVFRRPAAEVACELVETTTATPLRLMSATPPFDPASTGPVLGAATQPAGAAPALGSAKPDPAAEDVAPLVANGVASRSFFR